MADPTTASASKPRVLVADDEQVIANTLAIILNQAGFEARAVFSGEKEIGRVHRLGEDLEFMPLGTGLFEEIRRCRLAGKEQDLALWQLTASDDGCFYAGHASHDDVADEHIGLEAFERLDGLFSAEHSASLKACLVKDNR